MPMVFRGIPLSWLLRIPKTFDFELDRVAAINTVRYDPVTAWSWRFYNGGSYGANVYMRAATLLRTLEGLLGGQTWARIMRTYHMRYRYKHPGKTEFIGVVNEVAGKDVSWFFDELFESTQAFDYGVAGVASVKVPRARRGVFEVKGTREEMTSKKIEELDAVEAKSPEAKAKPEYLTTVVLRRYGEARVRGDARIKVLVRFKDGTTETRFWDGQARWARLEFVKPAEVESAQIDPEGVWLIDANLANNSRGVDGIRRNVVKLMTQLLFTVQSFLHFVSSLS
jgi:hypothetical protein